MGDVRRGHARVATVLVMVAAGLLAVVSGPAAVAAGPWPTSCVEQVTGQVLEVPDYPAAYLQDLDVGLANNFDFDSDVRLFTGQPFSTPRFSWTLVRGPLPGPIRYVTFDNEAPALGFMPQPYPEEVRVAPDERFPYRSPDGTNSWYVAEAQRVYQPLRFTATLTWSDCDGDGDFVPDRYDDNCVGVANRDQQDRDGDGVGDPCDSDNDNDGVADASDNCPATANPDQTDWDGDRVGNACDSTPGTAPSTPTTTPTPVTTTPPGTGTPSPGCTSGCAYERTVGLRHQARKHRLVGMVDSVALGCRAGVEVTLWRKRSGDDRKLVVVTTRAKGSFRTKAPRRAGRYYATVGSPDQPLCATATSRVVRVKRR